MWWKVFAKFLANLGPNTSFSVPNWCLDCRTIESTTYNPGTLYSVLHCREKEGGRGEGEGGGRREEEGGGRRKEGTESTPFLKTTPVLLSLLLGVQFARKINLLSFRVFFHSNMLSLGNTILHYAIWHTMHS